MRQALVILHLQWLLLKNSLRSRANVVELIARVFLALSLIAVDLAASVGIAVLTYAVAAGPHAVPLLTCLFAALCLAWQTAPLVTASFAGGLNVSRLRLYPISARQLFALDLLAGLADPVALLAFPPLAAILIAVVAAVPEAAPFAAAAAVAFVAFNVGLSRFVQGLVEKLLTSRRRKELLLGLFCVLIFLPQMLVGLNLATRVEGPRGNSGSAASVEALARQAATVAGHLAWTPPGLAARGVAGLRGESAAGSLGVLAASALFAAGALLLSYRRLTSEYRGRAGRTAGSRRRAQPAAPAAPARPSRLEVAPVSAPEAFGLLTPACAAIAVKELRYLYRAPRALMTVVAPVAASAIFMGSAVRLFAAGGLGQYALPGLSFYTLLVTSQFFTNAFAFDSHGAKLYFVAPVRGRDVIVGKNLALGGVAAFTVGVVVAFFHFAVLPVTPGVLVSTALVTGIALLLMLATGNFLSILYPQATSPSKLSGSANGMQILLSLAWLVVISGALALGPAIGWLSGSQALVFVVYGLELAASAAAYFLLLGRASRLLEQRGERFLQALLRQ